MDRSSLGSGLGELTDVVFLHKSRSAASTLVVGS